MDFSALEEHARAKIIEAGGLSIPGPEKLDRVLDAVERKLDELIEPKSPIAELASDAGIRAARWFVRAWLQSRYEKARADGLVR